MEDGELEVHNGEVERRIKHFAVGRSNWNLSDSKAGAEASVILYTALETAKANGCEPFAYLAELLCRIPNVASLVDFEAMLRWKCPFVS